MIDTRLNFVIRKLETSSRDFLFAWEDTFGFWLGLAILFLTG